MTSIIWSDGDAPEQLDELSVVLNGIAECYRQRIIVSTYPRTRERLGEAGIIFHPCVEFMKPLRFRDYVSLQMNARAVLSDSGTISEESPILIMPASNNRDAHERPEAMEEASVMLVGLNAERAFQALDILADQGRGEKRLLYPADDYSCPNVSDKVLRLIVSYTNYVNQVVWH